MPRQRDIIIGIISIVFFLHSLLTNRIKASTINKLKLWHFRAGEFVADGIKVH